MRPVDIPFGVLRDQTGPTSLQRLVLRSNNNTTTFEMDRFGVGPCSRYRREISLIGGTSRCQQEQDSNEQQAATVSRRDDTIKLDFCAHQKPFDSRLAAFAQRMDVTVSGHLRRNPAEVHMGQRNLFAHRAGSQAENDAATWLQVQGFSESAQNGEFCRFRRMKGSSGLDRLKLHCWSENSPSDSPNRIGWNCRCRRCDGCRAIFGRFAKLRACWRTTMG